jgi:prepilin-type N-terminal cleavage/methylation domain-containing protein
MNQHLVRRIGWIRTPGPRHRPGRNKGFTLIEALLATVIFSFVAGAALYFVSAAKEQTRKRSTQTELEEQGRLATETLVNDVRYSGYYTFINDDKDVVNNRQHSIIEASNYRLAFYADVDPGLYSPLESMTSDTWKVGNGSEYEWMTFPNLFKVTFPGGTTTTDGEEYFAQIGLLTDVPEYLKRNAEVIVYTMDTDEDGAFGPADKAQFDAGSTANPSDAVIRRKVIGSSFQDDGSVTPSTSISTVATNVRVYFDPSTDRYPNGLIPAPLFVYVISDSFARFDFNKNGVMDTFVFGDCVSLDDPGCGDGVLEQNEIAALQGLTQANPSDIMLNTAIDARLAANGTSPDVITRMRARWPSLTDADAQQLMRDCISSIRVNMIIEHPDPRPRTADVRYSTPTVPYRYLQHDVSTEVFLPNAYMLSKNQLVYSTQYLTNTLASDGVASPLGTNTYASALCPPASKSNDHCWPIRP